MLPSKSHSHLTSQEDFTAMVNMDNIMAPNDTLNDYNSTVPHDQTNSGVAVGLPIFFVILAIVIGAMAYLYFRRRKSKHVHSSKSETIGDRQCKSVESHHTVNSPEVSEAPVYENFREKPSEINPTRHYSNMDFASARPAEPGDLYMQCDSEHDAIYSNDPSFRYCTQPDNGEEDVYIVPDA